MEVNVSNLKADVDKLNGLIDEYELNYMNLYNQLNFASSLWNDNVSNQFFDKVKIEKSKIFNNIQEFKSLKNTYSYIIECYQNLGNKISYNLNERDNIYNKFNSYLFKINEIIGLYDRLDLREISEKNIIQNEKNKMKDVKNNIEAIYNNIKGIFENIENIEAEVSSQLSHINIELLKES